MIIGFCGRMRSGKTELSKICEYYGFERLYFALPLKNLIANLIDKTIDEVNDLKNVKSEYVLCNEKIEYLSNEIGVDIEIIRPLIENKVFSTTRELLQYIGTDIIRNYNSDWHVNKIRTMISNARNYVIDDVRFNNEKEMIEEMNGVLFFVVRPELSDISNHISETTLHWQNFSNIIVNDNHLGDLQFRWESFMKNGIVTSLMKRANLLNKLNVDEKLRESFLSSPKTSLTIFDLMFISRHLYTYDSKFSVKNDNIEKIENFNNCIFRVYYKNGDAEVVTNPLMIEDLKFYYKDEN